MANIYIKDKGFIDAGAAPRVSNIAVMIAGLSIWLKGADRDFLEDLIYKKSLKIRIEKSLSKTWS